MSGHCLRAAVCARRSAPEISQRKGATLTPRLASLLVPRPTRRRMFVADTGGVLNEVRPHRPT